MSANSKPLQWHRHLSLKQLRLVSVLGRELNLSRCAEQLHTTQPATSRLLAQTEALVGCRLFERSTKRVVPTAAGHSLVLRANRILRELELAEQEILGSTRAARGTLRIGVISVFPQRLLARAMARFRAQSPTVMLQVLVLGTEALAEQLLDGAIDLMLSHAELQVDLNRIEVLPLYEERNVLLVAPAARLAQRRRTSWDELAAWPWVLPPGSTPLRPKIDRILSVHRKRDSQVIDVETESTLMALQLVREAGMLWAVASRMAADLVQRGDAALVPTPHELLKGPICCMRLHEAARAREGQRFLACLRDEL